MTSQTSTAVVVIRYAEIFLKGANRPFFISKLVDNVRRALNGLDGVIVHRIHGRLIAEVAEHELGRATDRIKRVFGVQTLSPARVVVEDVDITAIGDEAVRSAGEALQRIGGRPTFKVECRRSNKSFPMTSQEICSQVGARVAMGHDLPVDVHNPQLVVGVEIGRERTFVFAETFAGPGGLPIGTTGRVNLLLSGGIDSPVAGWLAMKRGCSITATYFHSFPYTGDKTREKVTDLVRLLAAWHGPICLYVVPFTEVQKALRAAGAAELAVILYRRMMVRASGILSLRDDVNATALVTGDNLAQVASQTLENLAVVENAARQPVLRPLLTYDKIETVALAQKIGTYDTSIQPYEDCCGLFLPSHPATRARLVDVEEAEATLDINALALKLAQQAERVLVLA